MPARIQTARVVGLLLAAFFPADLLASALMVRGMGIAGKAYSSVGGCLTEEIDRTESRKLQYRSSEIKEQYPVIEKDCLAVVSLNYAGLKWSANSK